MKIINHLRDQIKKGEFSPFFIFETLKTLRMTLLVLSMHSTNMLHFRYLKSAELLQKSNLSSFRMTINTSNLFSSTKIFPSISPKTKIAVA